MRVSGLIRGTTVLLSLIGVAFFCYALASYDLGEDPISSYSFSVTLLTLAIIALSVSILVTPPADQSSLNGTLAAVLLQLAVLWICIAAALIPHEVPYRMPRPYTGVVMSLIHIRLVAGIALALCGAYAFFSDSKRVKTIVILLGVVVILHWLWQPVPNNSAFLNWVSTESGTGYWNLHHREVDFLFSEASRDTAFPLRNTTHFSTLVVVVLLIEVFVMRRRRAARQSRAAERSVAVLP